MNKTSWPEPQSTDTPTYIVAAGVTVHHMRRLKKFLDDGMTAERLLEYIEFQLHKNLEIRDAWNDGKDHPPQRFGRAIPLKRKCPTGKMVWKDEHDAGQALRETVKKPGHSEQSFYRCGRCGFFHLTKFTQMNDAFNAGEESR